MAILEMERRWTVLGKDMKLTDEQRKKAAAEKIWLHYYNRVLFEQGIITETERNRMKNMINCRKPSAVK